MWRYTLLVRSPLRKVRTPVSRLASTELSNLRRSAEECEPAALTVGKGQGSAAGVAADRALAGGRGCRSRGLWRRSRDRRRGVGYQCLGMRERAREMAWRAIRDDILDVVSQR